MCYAARGRDDFPHSTRAPGRKDVLLALYGSSRAGFESQLPSWWHIVELAAFMSTCVALTDTYFLRPSSYD